MTMRSFTAIGFAFVTALALGAVAQAAAPGEVKQVVQSALDAADVVPNGRVEILTLDRTPNTCAATKDLRAEVPRPVDGSGRFGVKLVGTRAGGEPCQAWIWVRLRVMAQVSVATRAIRLGESFVGATAGAEREILPGRQPATGLEGAIAERSVGPGQMIEAEMAQVPGLHPGQSVRVVMVAGGLSIEQSGRAVACGRNRNCAVLPSGRHVDGTLVDGRLLVEMP
jgi:hypothetical protein